MILLTEMQDIVKLMVEQLKMTLSEETSWVEKQYEEMLEQYQQEQCLHNESYSITLADLRDRLSCMLTNTNQQVLLLN